jgi:predicted TIM-barrel fold metal-dependent hydrolase
MGGAVISSLAGNPLQPQLLDKSQQIDSLFQGVHSLFDTHAHLCGVGTSNSRCCVNTNMLQSPILQPYNNIKLRVFFHAAHIPWNHHDADNLFKQRLTDIAQFIHNPVKMVLLPLDAYHTQDGIPDYDKTGMMTPNEWVEKTANEHPHLFTHAISIHPYRKDALEQLEAWAKKGVKIVKCNTIIASCSSN